MKMNRLIACLILASLLGCKIPTKTKVLIYTKNGEGFVHNNIQASTQALQELCDEYDILYDVSDNPALFTEENLKQYDAIVFNNSNNDAFDNDQQRLIFKRYIQAGGGFVGIHSACGSERNWPWFWSMLGGKFLRHPAFQKFDVKIINHEHPSTSHFADTWKWEDEAYYLVNLNPGIEVLMAHDLTTITDERKAGYPGEVFGDYFPGAWCHEFEGSRSWYTSYGHEIDHYVDPDFRTHLIGGILWATEAGKPDFSKSTAREVNRIK